MNMKYFKLKYILSGLLIIALIVVIIMFFVGTLTPITVEYNNVDFNMDGFVDLQAEIDKAAENNETYQLNENKIVSHNEQYCLLINEDTTVLTLLLKDENWSETNPTSGKVMYTSGTYNKAAADNEKTASANLIINYYDSKGKLNSYDSSLYSVSYEDPTQKDVTYKTYQLRYLPEQNAVDILYNVGDHANIYNKIPMLFDRVAFEELYLGNTIFDTTTNDTLINSKKYTFTYDDGTTVTGVEMKYIGTGSTFSKEVADYITENNLGTVTEEFDKDGIGYYKLTDLCYPDNPTDTETPEELKGQFKLKLGEHYNCEGSPIVTNPFMASHEIKSLIENDGGGYMLISGDGETQYKSNNYLEHGEGASPTYKYPKTTSTNNVNMINFLYGGSDFITDGYKKNYTVYFDYNYDGEVTADEKFVYGGYHMKDADGNYMYDENGRPVQVNGSTKNENGEYEIAKLVETQNAIFNNTDAAKNISFQICLRVSLSDTGMECRILSESLKENQAKLAYVTLFPTLTTNSDSSSTGQIVLPDGSGGIISFNSVKDIQQVNAYFEKRFYGSDLSIPLIQESDFSRDLMLNMYGFVEQSDKKGLVFIADQGAAQVSVSADFKRSNLDKNKNSSNYAKVNVYFRESEDVKITSSGTFTKVSDKLYPEDLIFKYQVIAGENLSYVDVAEVYRDYLIEKYDLKAKDTTKEANISVNFLGAFTKKQIALGFVYDAELSLTTFKQASDIVDELKQSGVSDLTVSYTSWTEQEMTPEITTKAKVSNELGGKKGLATLSKHLEELGVALYPEYNPVTGNGYDASFGVLKYSSKSVSGSYSEIPSFVLSTGLADAKVSAQNVISPRYYNTLVDEFSDNVSDYSINGLLLTNIGSERTADYAKKIQIYSGASTKYQQKALDTANQKLSNGVMLNAPFDYALPYASYANNVPTTSTMYPIIDYSIPLYQLVISGLVDYSAEYINYQNDFDSTYNLLKAIETGSNLSFMISSEDPSILLDTDYTGFYDSYYSNWRNDIIYMNNVLNESGIYESRLVDHRYITDTLVQVEYENGLTILINYDVKNSQDPITGITVRGNWFSVIEKGA